MNTYDIDAYVTVTLNTYNLKVQAMSFYEAKKKAELILEENKFSLKNKTSVNNRGSWGLSNKDGSLRLSNTIEGSWTIQTLEDVKNRIGMDLEELEELEEHCKSEEVK